MSVTLIETQALARAHTPEGDVTEILNRELCGAKNVHGILRWLESGETFHSPLEDKHQLRYVMEGEWTIGLDSKDYSVKKCAGIWGQMRQRPSSPRKISGSKSSTWKCLRSRGDDDQERRQADIVLPGEERLRAMEIQSGGVYPLSSPEPELSW